MRRKENPFVQYIVLFILLSVAFFYNTILSMLMPENKRSTQKKKEQKLSTVLILNKKVLAINIAFKIYRFIMKLGKCQKP